MIWVVVYFGVVVGATIGPMPATMGECQAQARLLNSKWQAMLARGVDDNGHPITSRHRKIWFGCSDTQPRLGEIVT